MLSLGLAPQDRPACTQHGPTSATRSTCANSMWDTPWCMVVELERVEQAAVALGA